MTKKILSAFLAALMLCGALVIGAGSTSAADMPFTDVKAKNWFYDEVLYVYERSLMTGTTDTKFEPNGKLTRAMFVTILGRLAGAAETETDAFSDVKKKNWYSGYVGWAVEAGIVTGYEDGTFKPNKALSREEMAACISRYVDFMGITMPRENTAPAKFADGGKVAKWAREYVEMLRRAGIVNGDQNKNYNPKANITRAEMATIIMNLIAASGKAWQGYEPDAEFGESAIFGAKYLYTAGPALQGAMKPILDESGEYPYIYPVMDERYAQLSYQDDDSVGFSVTAVVGDLTRTPYVKICYKYENGTEPETLAAYMTARYTEPISRCDITFEKGEKDGEWSTATFNATADIINSIGAQFGRTQGATVHIMLKPYVGAENAKFCLAYIGLFETKEAADAFTLETEGDYLKNYYRYSPTTMEEVGEDTLDAYLEEVRERIAEIKNTESAITPADIEAKGGKCYYVSSINGDDSNDGRSPETPWKSTNKLWRILAGGKVNDPIAKPGDGVFFERGSEFYPSKYLIDSIQTLGVAKGVTYGAYGEGEKPAFYGSFDFGGGTGDWQKTEWENIYYIDTKAYIRKDLPDETEERIAHFGGEAGDIGSIIFNEGELLGVRVFPNDPDEPFGEGKTTKYMGPMGTCDEYYISGGTSSLNPADALRNNLEFIHDYSTGRVYLRCNDGDPKQVFDRIDLARNCFIFMAADNATFDNLRCLYSSWITFDLRDNNVVTNCEAGYAGGCTSSVGTGIGGYGACESMSVSNCYIHDVEDGPMGTQETGDFTGAEDKVSQISNVVLTNNVVTTSQNLVELFSTFRQPDEGGILGRNKIRNAVVKNNYGVYLGYGYPRKVDSGAEGLALHNWYYGEMINCEFSENTIIRCAGGIIGAHIGSDNNERGWKMYDNTYVLNPDHCDFWRGGDGIFNYTNLNMSYYCSFDYALPYEMRHMQYFTSIGIDTTGKFYFCTDETPGEAEGYFVTTGWHVERGNKPK